MRVLVAEDDRRVASFIRRGLVQEGFAVDLVSDGREAFAQAVSESYDVIVLDLMLPLVDGFEVVEGIRRQDCHAPVLILSARAAVADRVRGLDAGADDYVTKPFAFSELTARIRALLRRGVDLGESVIRIGDLELDTAARTVTRADHPVPLTLKEFTLLEYLVRNRGHVVTRTMIAEHVWDQHFDSFSNLIDVNVCHLRAKVEVEGSTKLIRTVRGVGYMVSEESP